MKSELLEEMRRRGHDDDQRYRLLMQYLKETKLEKQKRGLLRRLKNQWQSHLTEDDRKR